MCHSRSSHHVDDMLRQPVVDSLFPEVSHSCAVTNCSRSFILYRFLYFIWEEVVLAGKSSHIVHPVTSIAAVSVVDPLCLLLGIDPSLPLEYSDSPSDTLHSQDSKVWLKLISEVWVLPTVVRVTLSICRTQLGWRASRRRMSRR